MNKLEELINELCPDGVKKEKLKNLAEIGTGNSNRQDATEDGQYTFFVRSKDTLKSSSYEYDEEAIIIPGEGGIGEVFHYINDKYALHQRAYRIHVVSDLLDTKFLYHYMKSAFKKFITKKAVSATVTSIRKPMIEDFEVPLPPLSIQSEIVHILDSFTLLTAELTAELTARQKQYAFYRDYLLDFSDEDVTKRIPDIDCSNVEYIKLGDIALVTKLAGYEFTKYVTYSDDGKIIALRGLNVKNGQLVLDDVKYIDNSNLSKLNRSKLVIGDMLFTYVGTIGQVALIDENDRFYLAPNVAMIRLNDKEKILPKYLMHFFQTNLFWNNQINKLLQSSSMKNIPMEKIRKFVIPVPPLSVQENIVKILDRFDKLNNDMSEGLPAEIEARKKQYEYYRDTLLSFDDKACSHIVKVERERELTRSKAIKWLKLGEIGKVRMCKRILKSQTNTQFGVPFYKIGTFGKKADAYVSNELFNEYKLKYSYPKKGDILISCSGTIGRTVVFNGEPAYFQDSNIVWLENDESVVLNTYLKYCYDRQPWRAESGGTIARLYNANIENAVIPVPPLEEQERIVSILDRFDKLCNDISEGLPAEIEARQKQYEYYRDKLLTFKEKIVY